MTEYTEDIHLTILAGILLACIILLFVGLLRKR